MAIGDFGTARTKSLRLGGLSDLLEDFGNEIIKALQNNLDSKGINASSNLRQSIDFTVKILGDNYRFQLSLEDYYKWVDKGRKTGRMPPDKFSGLKGWISHKGIKPPMEYNVKVKTKKGIVVKRRRFKDIIQANKSLSFLIRRKIGMKGTKATNFYSDVINAGSLNKLKADISKALKRDVIIEIQELKKEIK